MSTGQIKLITGRPGNGKSLLTVSKVDEWFPNRPIYYHNIKDLKLSWLPIPDPEKWYELPEGSVVVFDEAQDTFPTRSGKEPVPEKCKAFEKLRHRGLTAVVVTQMPRQIDIHLRMLVGEHIHIERIMGSERAVTFTWPKVCEDVDDKQKRQEAVKGIFAYPKASYELYKSAEIHTIKRKLPWPFLAIPVALALVGYLAYSAYDTLIAKRTTSPDTAPASVLPAPINAVMNPGSPGQQQDKVMTTPEYLAHYTPRIPGLPHTAPAYDGAMQVKTAPKPSACIASRKKCTCYTDQATPILMGDQLCRDIASNGMFDPSQQSHQAAVALQDKPPSPVTMPAGAI